MQRDTILSTHGLKLYNNKNVCLGLVHVSTIDICDC